MTRLIKNIEPILTKDTTTSSDLDNVQLTVNAVALNTVEKYDNTLKSILQKLEAFKKAALELDIAWSDIINPDEYDVVCAMLDEEYPFAYEMEKVANDILKWYEDASERYNDAKRNY